MRKVLSLTQEESLRARDRGTISHIPPVLTIPIPHLLPKERIDTGTSSNHRKGYLYLYIYIYIPIYIYIYKPNRTHENVCLLLNFRPIEIEEKFENTSAGSSSTGLQLSLISSLKTFSSKL